MQTLYSSEKVNNEIELCEVSNMECKSVIERELLRHRISYYIRWPKSSFFSRKKDICIICVNDSVRDQAESVVRAICDESGYNVKFLMKRTPVTYF